MTLYLFNQSPFKMEYTCYHFHSNRLTRIYVFIKDCNNNILVKNISFNDIEEYYDEFEFVIDTESLKNMDVLNDFYKLSCLLTKDKNELIEVETGYALYTKKNWKGLYLKKDYGISYIFSEYPSQNITVDSHSLNVQNIKKFESSVLDDKDIYDTTVWQNNRAYQMYNENKYK